MRHHPLPWPYMLAAAIGLTVYYAWPPAYAFFGPWDSGSRYWARDALFGFGLITLGELLRRVFPKRLGGKR